jgi:lipopolysaccharide biosynthesis glycosyltransferase
MIETTWRGAWEMRADCLGQAIAAPMISPAARWCLVTLGSAGYEQQIHELFLTLEKYAKFPNIQKVVFNVGNAPGIFDVAARHGALAIPTTPTRRITPAIKGLLYSAAQFIESDYYLCCDADVYFVQSLDQLTEQVERNPRRLFAARAAQTHAASNPQNVTVTAMLYYAATVAQARELHAATSAKPFLHLNSGVFAASREQMLKLDSTMREIAPTGLRWLERANVGQADELLFSIAIARAGNLSELGKVFNLQLYAEDTCPEWLNDELVFHHDSDRAKILHFAAAEGRAKYPHYRELLSIS